MFKGIISRFLDVNQKEIEKLQKTVEKINELEKDIKKLKDGDFAKRTDKFKKDLKDGKTMDDILPEAYALAREATWRTLGKRHFDVQMMAAIALYQGKVVEQKTGEGKTLAAVPALYLRSLSGKGGHLVTVNDYLARRDAGWNAPIFQLLGLSVGVIIQENKSFIYDINFSDKSHGDERLEHLKPCSRKQAYDADVTYGTNNEFGFDYLRDNMVSRLEDKSQRGHYFAIVDEVDSVLIDEARTPLIISAPDTDPTDKYVKFASLVEDLNSDTDYKIDEKSRSANLTDRGIVRVEKLLNITNLYEKDYRTIHHVENALRAKTLYIKDKDYVVKDGEVIIVDEFTGRLMPGRRWSDGMHQAVEAKERVLVRQESKTLATISFQNLFRMYDHLSGMTGTAATEAEEFKKIYDLDVVVVPTNKPLIRKDHSDMVYKSLRGKYGSIVKEIAERSKNGQPVLVGTTSIEKNEIISNYLKRKNIKHNTLNAKNHEKEAMIIAEAGFPGAVTVATNMAGRGVDIVLGGALPDRKENQSQESYEKSAEYKKWKERHKKAIDAGGLHVIGTERHESRRIDNQLRGRSGRQGDPGSTRFYLSLEDDLMRVFGGEQISSLMDRLKLPEDAPIENKLVSRAIEQAQIKVEGFHFDARKDVVEYDDVANQQRDIIYKKRNRILESDDLKDEIFEKLEKQVDRVLTASTDIEDKEFDIDRCVIEFLEIIPFDSDSKERVKKELSNKKIYDDRRELLVKVINDVYDSREKQFGEQAMRRVEKFAYLGSIDHLWIEHIDYIDGLRTAVRLRGAAQRDPKSEYKNEAYNAFEELLNNIDQELSRRIFRTQVVTRPTSEIPLDLARTNIDTSDQMGLAGGSEMAAAVGEPAFSKPGELSASQGRSAATGRIPLSKNASKIGRNDPCWCGSGKKWKKCHYPERG